MDISLFNIDSGDVAVSGCCSETPRAAMPAPDKVPFTVVKLSDRLVDVVIVGCLALVSYTHFTLPTVLVVDHLVVLVSVTLKKIIQFI